MRPRGYYDEWDEYDGGPGRMPKYPPILSPAEAEAERRAREKAERPGFWEQVGEGIGGVVTLVVIIVVFAVVLAFLGWPIPFIGDIGPSCGPQSDVNPC
jgi:hypothetical protein